MAVIGDEYLKKFVEVKNAKEDSEIISRYAKKEHLEHLEDRWRSKRLLSEIYEGRAGAAYYLALKAGGNKELLLKRLRRLAGYIKSLAEEIHSDKLLEEHAALSELIEKYEKKKI